MHLFGGNERQSPMQHESCVCDGKEGIFLNNRHMSWALSVILLLNFFVFMAGYFFGKKKVVDHLNYKIDQESLTDHVYSSMYALYDSKVQPESSDNVEPGDEAIDTEVIVEEITLEQSSDVAPQIKQTESDKVAPTDTAITTGNEREYYAQLVGFSSERAAQQFVQKLAHRDITAHIKQRPSKTAKGKVVYWYQVITETFTKKEDLMALVQDIKRREKLHDVRIITA